MAREAEKSISDSAREATPIPEHRRPTKTEQAERVKGSVTTFNGKRDAEYLTARIARDHKDILERMKAGERSHTNP
jgi:hypothetical protein